MIKLDADLYFCIAAEVMQFCRAVYLMLTVYYFFTLITIIIIFVFFLIFVFLVLLLVLLLLLNCDLLL